MPKGLHNTDRTTSTDLPKRCAKEVAPFAGQVQACAICGATGDLEQDHDHETDLCRGKLCSSCNHLVARYDRPIEQIDRFLGYLRFWAAEHAIRPSQTYTDYMRELFPRYRKRGPGGWIRKAG